MKTRLFLVGFALWAAQGIYARTPTQTGLEAHPWLEDLALFRESYDFSKDKIEAQTSGAYVVGNGRSFALIGLSAPLWNWSNLYGASYQEPSLGSIRMSVRDRDGKVILNRQTIRWVRRSGVVRVTAQNNSMTVDAVDFAPAAPDPALWDNPAALVRWVRVRNTGDRKLQGVILAFHISGGWDVETQKRPDSQAFRFVQQKKRAKARTYWMLGALEGRAQSADRGLEVALGDIPPGEEKLAAVALASDGDQGGLDRTWDRLRKAGVGRLLEDTHDFWTAWFSQGVRFSGDPKLCDLFDTESWIFKAQESYSGCFSPLIGYSYAWIRDHNGPIRWFLKSGHASEASAAVDFFPRLAAAMGSLPNSVRVDASLQPKLKDLSGIDVEHAETPNWIILQHWWRYMSDGDLDKIRSRWAFLKRCLSGQVKTDHKFFFHRDETYLWCLESRTFPHVGYPNDYLTTYGYTVDSSFGFVAAADRLAFLAKRLGKENDAKEIQGWADAARTAAQETFWDEAQGYWRPSQSLLGPMNPQPFANILLNPLWCGYARPEGDPLGSTPEENTRASRALEAGFRFLGRPDGFWKTTPSVDYFVGMNAGQLLWGLLEEKSPWAEKAYNAVWKCASPSGDFSEMYDGKYRPFNPVSWGVGTSGRVRPWEGGLDTEALFHYVTGFQSDAADQTVRFAPHLPKGQERFGAEGLQAGSSKLDFRIEKTGEGEKTVWVKLQSGGALRVRMDLWGTERGIGTVETEGEIVWVQKPSESKGGDGVLTFSIREGEERKIRWTEGETLPDALTRIPELEEYDPPPFAVEKADVVLFTSPSAVLASLKPVAPRHFQEGAQSEKRLLESLGLKTSVLDMDLPLRPSDVAASLLDDQGKPKARLAVFGRGAFSPGKHDFKPVSFWEDASIAKAFEKFLESGGSVVIGQDTKGSRGAPQWLQTLAQGAWDGTGGEGEAVLAEAEEGGGVEKTVDEIDVADDKSEKRHEVTVEKVFWRDRLKLPEGLGSAQKTEDDGIGFGGDYLFTLQTIRNAAHRLKIRLNAARPTKGLALSVEKNGQWVPVGVRTQEAQADQRWLTVWFDIPAALTPGDRTRFRLFPKGTTEVNAYHLWLSATRPPQVSSLAEGLGFSPDARLGNVPHGLSIVGKGWKAPVVLSGAAQEPVLILRKQGNGFLVKTELPLDDCGGILQTLASPEKSRALMENELW